MSGLFGIPLKAEVIFGGNVVVGGPESPQWLLKGFAVGSVKRGV